MKFMLGANYWGAGWGTEMWLHYDGEEIRKELKKLSEYGVQCLRVFPNWRDFQPVDQVYGWRGGFGEYLNGRTGEPVYGDGVDEDMICHFRDFCHGAEEYGISLVVSVVTGWMSGRLFVPPALKGKNLISDSEALMWMKRFIHRFVREMKDEKSIIMWDLGNECNCLGASENLSESYLWTSSVVDAIRSEDNTRPVSSGMHSLGKDNWSIAHQGELTDMLTTHPYPSPTVGGDTEPYNSLRMTFLPTAQSLYYAGLSGRPAYIQESGTFSQTIGSDEMSAQFMRIQILSALVNNLCGYQWWCAWEQEHLNYPPYSWSMMERQLGMFYGDGCPKPVAYTMKAMSELIDRMPENFPKRTVDGICVLSRDQEQQMTAIASLIFGKQAGIDLDVAYSDHGELPKADLYFLPAITGWQVLYKKTWDELIERVKEGAILYISYNGGQLTDFTALVGAESKGVMAQTTHSAQLGDTHFAYSGKEILLKPTTAQVLARNEEGNPVVLKNSLGKGTIYFVNFAPELLAFSQPNGFNKEPYYQLYRVAGSGQIAQKPVALTDPGLGLTVNPVTEDSCFVSILNYTDREITPEITLHQGFRIAEVLYGDISSIPACDGVICRIER